MALTAHVAGTAADNWRDAGMDDYLTKPFTIRSLADCLMRWQPAGDPSAAISAADPPVAPDPAEPREEDSPPLDPTVLQSLRAITGGSDAVLRKLFGLFQSHAPARLAALREAAEASDYDRIASEAHALKSPSVNIGALRLGALCADVEARARNGDATLLSEGALAVIEAELARVLDAIVEEAGSDVSLATSYST